MISLPTSAGPPTFYFKASREPMLWAAVTYSSGIIAGVYEWRPVLWWVAAAVGFVFAAAYFACRRSALGWTLALASFFLAGALHVQVRQAFTTLDTSIQPYANGQELQITAHVTRDGRVQDISEKLARPSTSRPSTSQPLPEKSHT